RCRVLPWAHVGPRDDPRRNEVRAQEATARCDRGVRPVPVRRSTDARGDRRGRRARLGEDERARGAAHRVRCGGAAKAAAARSGEAGATRAEAGTEARAEEGAAELDALGDQGQPAPAAAVEADLEGAAEGRGRAAETEPSVDGEGGLRDGEAAAPPD